MIFRKKDETEHIVSKWRKADFILCMLIIFLSPLAMRVDYYWNIVTTAFIFAVIIGFFRCLYYVDKPKSRLMKIMITVVRSALYSVAIIGTIIPFINTNAKWYYPIDRALFLSNYVSGVRLNDFIIEEIPKNAEDCKYIFEPKILQGSATAYVHFYTDSTTIQQYRTKAEKYGAEHYKITDEKVVKWFNFMQKNNADTEDAEVYIFWENQTSVYMINEKTGYFSLYY